MVHAQRIYEYGGPDVLRWEAIDLAAPGAGEIRLRQHAIGLNYIDVYTRSGLYPQPEFPFTCGMEGAGEVIAVGEGVSDFTPGDRVAYAGPIGAYADERLLTADRAVKIPDSIDYETAAAMMLKGMTVSYLFNRTYKVGPQTTMLFHAAAGGVGLIACEWAAHLGATVIGTVSSDEKAALAKARGCSYTINYTQEDFAQSVHDITDGEGVDVVYDSIGQATFPQSLDCLKPLGLWVSFGQASGPVPDFNIGILGQKGSLFATRASLFTYIDAREDLLAISQDLIDLVASGRLTIPIHQRYELKDAAQAHRDLEARKTVGSSILLPEHIS